MATGNDAAELIELYFQKGWTDGLPVAPPSESSVGAMLEAAGLKGSDVIAEIGDRLIREFKVGANVGKPQVAYRETLLKEASGEAKHVKQTGGRGQYGHVKLRVEPQPDDRDFEFVNASIAGALEQIEFRQREISDLGRKLDDLSKQREAVVALRGRLAVRLTQIQAVIEQTLEANKKLAAELAEIEDVAIRQANSRLRSSSVAQ